MKRLHLYALLCCVLIPIGACQRPATAEQAPASAQATKRADEPKAPVHPGYETRKVGNFDLSMPRVAATTVYLWPDRPEWPYDYPYGPYPAYYDPFWYGGFYPRVYFSYGHYGHHHH